MPNQTAMRIPVPPKRKQAWHEAGHAVVIDELGWEVLWVNIKDGDGNPRMVKADWKGFESELQGMNWGDAGARETIKLKVLRYVTCLVAGHLAENDLDPDEQRISARMTPELLDAGKNGNADRDKVAHFLKRVGCNTMPNVLAAEERAYGILKNRQDHLRALADLLIEQEYVDGKPLRAALGK